MKSELAIEPVPALPPRPAGESTKSTLPELVAAPGYYGLPMLKKPLWGWQIALYFFGEGISSGCYLIATAAEYCGWPEHGNFSRTARLISLATMMPCPALLIADLGRAERFIHMLRVFKPSSPMNLGAWALTAFGLPVTILALVPSRRVALAGLVPAVVMMSYPGVLLSSTSTPVWARTRLLGALLASSSMLTAAAALALANSLGRSPDGSASHAVRRIEQTAHLCEAGLVAGFLMQSGNVAEPLTRGKQARLFWFGAVGCGLVLPWLMRVVQGKRPGRGSNIFSALCTLTGGLALKWSIVQAGHDSALDPDAAREMARATREHPGWGHLTKP